MQSLLILSNSIREQSLRWDGSVRLLFLKNLLRVTPKNFCMDLDSSSSGSRGNWLKAQGDRLFNPQSELIIDDEVQKERQTGFPGLLHTKICKYEDPLLCPELSYMFKCFCSNLSTPILGTHPTNKWPPYWVWGQQRLLPLSPVSTHGYQERKSLHQWTICC